MSNKNWYAALEYIRVRDIMRTEARVGISPSQVQLDTVKAAEYRMDYEGKAK